MGTQPPAQTCLIHYYCDNCIAPDHQSIFYNARVTSIATMVHLHADQQKLLVFLFAKTSLQLMYEENWFQTIPLLEDFPKCLLLSVWVNVWEKLRNSGKHGNFMEPVR